MAGYNEKKLGYLADNGPSTAREIAELIGITLWGASSYLLKLHRRGLVGRKRVGGPSGSSRERIYYLQERGRQRLAWLEEQEGVFYIEESDDDTVLRPRWAE